VQPTELLDQIVSFLSQNSEYAPHSGTISAVFKQMKETMEGDLATATANEKTAKENYAELMKAKTKEIDVCTKAIEDKTARVGNFGVEMETMKGALSDTQQDMLEDKKLVEGMDEQCAAKKKEWDERCKMRTEELLVH